MGLLELEFHNPSNPTVFHRPISKRASFLAWVVVDLIIVVV